MSTQAAPSVTQLPTLDAIAASLDETWARLSAVVDRFAPALDAGPDPGGWTARQALSHLVGALQRVPVHAAFYVDADPSVAVPVHPHDPYWIAEWETAPLAAFTLATRAAYEGNKAFLRELDPAALATVRSTPFGDMPLATLLLTSYGGHIAELHIPQLEAFLASS
jgi:hypothetical protein